MSVLASAANAQNGVISDIFMTQPSLTEKLKDLSPSQPLISGENNPPSAQNATPANTADVTKTKDVLVQSQEITLDNTSVVQQYFEILTGKNLQVYGAREFSQQQDDQVLFFNTVGKEYQLAPGDVLRVTIRGLDQSDQIYNISNDGSLILPNLPPIVVSGLTINEIEKRLLNLLKYDDPSAGVFISLKTARLITVQVSGAVNKPRTLAVPAYTPLSRVLAYAGGVQPNGSLRNIVLRDRNGSVEELDFYDFLQSPLGSNDPVVTGASRLFVPDQGATVAAVGFVARPGIYELKKGETAITVRELLKLSGTTTLPPGVVLEAKFFNKNGVSSTRTLSPTDKISAGEALNLHFVQTRLQKTIAVSGAVLDEYSIASNSDIAIKELLKDGSTLKPNANRSFAMIIGAKGNVSAINLEHALSDPTYMISSGDKLVVFDQLTYRSLVDSDINNTDQPLVAAIRRAEVSELYINGKRLAFIPSEKRVRFAETLRQYYRVTPEINLELAVIETIDGDAKAVNLRALLQSKELFPIASGSKIHLFETVFLNNFVNRQDMELFYSQDMERLGSQSSAISSNDQEANKMISPGASRSASLTRLLTRANIVRVKLDDELVAVLPQTSRQEIAAVLNVLGLDQSVSTLIDLVELELRSATNRPEYKSASLLEDYLNPIPALRGIKFWSKTNFQRYLDTTPRQNLERLFAIAVPVFVDYKLVNILSPSAFHTSEGAAANLIYKEKIYPLFSVLNHFQTTSMSWEATAQLPSSYLKSVSESVPNVKPGDQLSLFTRNFITSKLNGGRESYTADENDPNILTADVGSNLLVSQIENQGAQPLQKLGTTRLEQFSSAMLKSYSQFVGGAVQRPGWYPIATAVTLKQVIGVAGNTLPNADPTKITLQSLVKRKGALVRGKLKILNMELVGTGSVVLDGQYYVEVPFLINEIATGVVTLSGEVMRPGEYVIARDETVHDVIKRAGGLSPVAYPLGAVFSRKTLKKSEQNNNEILASQLEKAVIQIASSESENAEQQAKSLMAYAEQLRTMPTTGRMSVNVAYEREDTPVYMQNDDRLFIPKRPSHVFIMGAVGKDTSASYAPGKTPDDYMNAAGGPTKIADLKNSYLLLPNGESRPLSRDSQIPPGAVIVVVPRTDRLSILGLTELISRVMGNIATSVLAINNVK